MKHVLAIAFILFCLSVAFLAGVLSQMAMSSCAHAADLISRDNFDARTECQYAPAGLRRQTQGDVFYIAAWQHASANLTRWENVWGRCRVGDALQAWPAMSNCLAAISAFGRDDYLAFEFTVPSLPLAPLFAAGRVQRGDTLDTVARTSASISESCGDFTSVVPPACRISGGNQASTLIAWSVGGIIPGTCALTPGHTYYLNLEQRPIGGTAHYCASPTCEMSLVQYQIATGTAPRAPQK